MYKTNKHAGKPTQQNNNIADVNVHHQMCDNDSHMIIRLGYNLSTINKNNIWEEAPVTIIERIVYNPEGVSF